MLNFFVDNFIDYCNEDNPKLADEFQTWLIDYFDFQHRTIPVSKDEIKWVNQNITPELQVELFGLTINKIVELEERLIDKDE